MVIRTSIVLRTMSRDTGMQWVDNPSQRNHSMTSTNLNENVPMPSMPLIILLVSGDTDVLLLIL